MHVEERDHLAKGVRQAADRLQDGGDPLALLEPRVGSGFPRRKRRRGVERQRVPVLLPEEPVGLVADDAAEPAGERGRVGQGPQPEPRGDEGLLDDVLRLLQVTQEGQGVAEGHLLKASRHLRERVQVSLPRPPDQRLQVHWPLHT